MKDDVLKIKTLMERWGCSRSHIYELMKAGKLKTFKVGALRRVHLSEVERFERENSEDRLGTAG